MPKLLAGSRSERPKGDLTTQLIVEFKKLIFEGKLVPGSKLPPERMLARDLKVSRSSLRQALKVLTVMGVLSQKVGSGTYLNGSGLGILKEPMQLLILMANISHSELFEARAIIEPELAARAAERATAQDVTKLRHLIECMKKYGTDAAKIIEFDVLFHQAVFEAAGNRLCQAMFGVLHEALLTSISRTTKMVDVDHTVRFHTAICSAIRRRLPDEARKLMIEHLLDAQRVLLDSGLSQETAEDTSLTSRNRRRTGNRK